MTSHDEVPRVVSAGREIAVGPAQIFELIAEPAQQPRWDANENLAGAPGGQRVGRAGEGVLDDAHQWRRCIAWNPAEPGQRPPGHLWRWDLERVGASRTRVACTYDWTRLTDESRLPRARATTPDKLRASLDRLAALAEGPLPSTADQQLPRGRRSAPLRAFRLPGRRPGPPG